MLKCVKFGLAKYAAVIAVMLVVASGFLHAQQQPAINPDVYGQLKYRYIGPEGNRATSVAGVPGKPNIWYVGAASGGIFKSTDGGIHWGAIFDSEPVASIGSLAVAASDPNIVWAGFAGGGGERSEHCVGGNWGIVHSQPHLGGTRDLQVRGCGQDVDLDGIGKDGAHRAGGD